eukprot:748008-Hanusia_phi.AAC.7
MHKDTWTSVSRKLRRKTTICKPNSRRSERCHCTCLYTDCDQIKSRMKELKARLTLKFGKSINLEEDDS